MVNKKSFLLYGLFTVLFIVYLIKANDIFLMFDSSEQLKKVKFNESDSKSEVYVNLDGCELLGGLMEKVYFQGWGFCETTKDNSDKSISLIFKNIESDECYEVETAPQTRPDVYGAFRESKNIWNEMNGIECQFSTIKMKAGIYDFYVFVRENESDYGVLNMQRRFEKNSKGLIEIKD